MPIKKIVCIAMTFPAPTETFHSNNTKALSEQGKEVFVFSLLPKHKDHNKLVEQRSLSKIKVNSCNLLNYIVGSMVSIFHPLLTLSLMDFIVFNTRGKHLVKSLVLIPRVFYIWSKIRKAKPDVVNLLWGHYPLLVGLLIKRTNSAILLSMGLLAYDLEMGYGGSHAIAPYVDIIWTQAAVNIPPIRKLGFRQNQVHVIYDGLDRRVSEGKKSKIPFRVVTAGRLVKPKGMDLCIKAIALIAKSYPDTSLIVLGEGPENENLESFALELGISERVFFKGHVSMEEIAGELSASDVFLFMSHKERLPNVVKEALLNKAICIVSPTPGIEELVQDGKTGYALRENTPEEAAAYLMRVFVDRATAESFREAGYRFVLDRFDCRQEMKRLVAIWEDQIEIRRVSSCASV